METVERAETQKIPSKVREAFHAWNAYSEQAESLVHLTHDGLRRVQIAPEISKILDESLESETNSHQRKHEIENARRAEDEARSGFPTLHAHSLLGLWGAFESFIEDLVIAVLHTQPELLDGHPFTKVRIPVSVVSMTDDHERTAAIFYEASKTTGAELALGTTKFERQLKLVGLDGAVPPLVSENIYKAQQIRNIWAHRGGKADTRFVERCPNLGFHAGDRVMLDYQTFSPLMHGLHMYGTVILNRYLESMGREVVFAECPGYKGSLQAKEDTNKKI